MTWSDRFSLSGRKALVTGASKGIGLGICDLFAEAGADVVAVARDRQGLAEACRLVEAHGRRCLVVEADMGTPEGPVAAAREALAGHAGTELVEGPLEAGAPGHAPYDVLMIDGAVEFVPNALIDQLAPDGRVVTGLVDRNIIRLASGRRSAGGFGLVGFADVDCVVLPGFSRPRGFSF